MLHPHMCHPRVSFKEGANVERTIPYHFCSSENFAHSLVKAFISFIACFAHMQHRSLASEGSQPTFVSTAWGGAGQTRPARTAGQPIAVPLGWPTVGSGKKTKPATYVYRSMRVTMDDMVSKFHPAHEMEPDSDEMRTQVAIAICEGSKFRSPFLHSSNSIFGARRFRAMGQALRGEQQQTMVRINIWQLYEEGQLAASDVIDMSCRKGQGHFFQKGPGGYGTYVEDRFAEMLQHASKAEEVVLKWRGSIPTCAFEVAYVHDLLFMGSL